MHAATWSASALVGWSPVRPQHSRATRVCTVAAAPPSASFSGARAAQLPRAAQHKLAGSRRAPARRRLVTSAGAGAGEREDGMAPDPLVEMAALDGLIDSMLEAQTDDELTTIVQPNVMSLNQKFFLRIATRSDSSADDDTKDRLSVLSGKVMRLLDAIVKKTEGQISQSAELLQTICAAAADPVTGEFEVPLAPERVSAMRQTIVTIGGEIDESTVAQVYAWIRKSSDDGLDGMVVILQRVLQLYAACALVPGGVPRAEEATVLRALEEVLVADVEAWDAKLEEAVAGGHGGQPFVDELHKKMEGVVLGMANGSYTQRVMAEYLKEVEERAKTTFA